MSQHDYNIANAGGAAVRSDMNNALAAVQSLNSGTTAPTATKPFMPWYDTTTGALKMRNAGDTAWISMAEAVAGGATAGLRNKIINGNMGIAQRGTAAVTTSSGYGPADRWRNQVGGDTFSTTIASFVSGDALYDTGGAQSYLQVAVTSVANTNNYAILLQRIEDARTLAGQTVTVSFWAKVAAGTPSIGVNLVQNFGTGGSPTAEVNVTGQAQALTTTWTKYTKTFTLGSLNGKTLGTDANSSYTALTFWLDAGATLNSVSGSIGQSSKTVSIAQVQLEIGAVATPFEQRPVGMELALCQRYYNNTTTVQHQQYGTGGSVYQWAHLFPTMRSTPTITFSGGTYNNSSNLTSVNPSSSQFRAQVSITATGNGTAYDWTVILSAEL